MFLIKLISLVSEIYVYQFVLGKNGFPIRLFNSCWVLEILSLGVAGVYKERTFKISIPTLRKLNLQMYTDPYRELESVFIIDAPVLDILSLIDNCGTCYVLENPLPIVERRLWWFTPKRQDLLGKHTYALRNLEKNFGLVNTFSQVKRLDLNNNDMADLGIADVKDWPLFSNLLELWVIVSGDPGFKSLSVLLIKAPMLESLNFVNEQSGQGNPHTWYKPQGSPRYLLTCLRTINLTIKGSQTDLSLIKYLLGNVRGLRKMTISFDIGKAKGDEFYGKLAKFPRRSQTCDITINDHLWIQGSKSCNAGLKRKFDESHIIVLD